MEFRELSLSDCEEIRKLRNQNLAMLRTPYMLTKEMQEDFYKNVVCNRNSNARYWGIVSKENGIYGMIGLDKIEWENSCAEISYIAHVYQQEVIEKLLNIAFNQMNLVRIYAECYMCNPNLDFWLEISEKYNSKVAYLPDRKFYNNEFFDSLYLSIPKEGYNNG